MLAQGWAADRLAWGVVVCLAGAVLSLIGRRALRQSGGHVLFVFGISAAAALTLIYVRRPGLAPIPQVAWTFAVISLLWSVAAAFAGRGFPVSADRRLQSSLGFQLCALLFGVMAVIIQIVVLIMRMIAVGLDLFQGYSVGGDRRYGFGVDGLWTLGFLFASCGVAIWSAQSRRLVTCHLWIAVMAVFWSCLLAAPFTTHAAGGFERSPMSVALTVSLAALLLVAVIIQRCVDQRIRWRQVHSDPDALARPLPPPPGFVVSCAVIGAALVVLTCYHVLVPVRLLSWGYSGSRLAVGLSAVAGAWASFLLLARSWHEGLADAALGLSSLAMCGLAILAVPSGNTPLSDLYPMLFNAMIVGLALATGIWTYLGSLWRQQLAGGRAWTTSGHLIPHVQRFAFLNAALALVAGALMTYWPRLPTVPAMDDTLGRVTAGFGAHLFLLLVMLWSSRRLHRLTFHLLTVLAVFTTAGFMVVRMIPFASGVVD